MADPMRALPGPCGASLGSEGPPKGQKYAFGTQKHPFREISRNYENRFKNFWSRIWSTPVLGFLHRFEVIRSTGGRGRAISRLERVRKVRISRNAEPRSRVLVIVFFGLQVPRMRTAQYLRKAQYPRNILRVPVALFRVRRNLSILATPEVQKQS